MAFNVLLWLEFTDVNLKPLNKDATIRGKYKVKKDINMQSNDINPNRKVMRNNISICETCTQMLPTDLLLLTQFVSSTV